MKIFRNLVINSITFTLILLLTGFSALAQERKTSSGIRHEVLPKETFYSLSKKYEVTIDDIKRANPGVDYPKVGTVLVIPVTSAQLKEQDPEFILYTTQEEISIYILARMLRHPADSLLHWNPGIPSFVPTGTEVKSRPAPAGASTIYHKVADDRSSLKDLSDLYNVPYKELRQYNPQLRNRVWQGQKVSIPVIETGTHTFDRIEVTGEIPVETDVEETEEAWTAECRPDPRNLKREYKVALLVPFSLEEGATIDTLLSGSPSLAMDKPSFRFVPFYQGFVLAADSLATEGLKLELKVYDVDQDVTKAREVVALPEMREVDLIVGPFYKNTFPVASEFARRNSIPIVNPLSAREDILYGNPEVFKIIPSVPEQVQVLSDLAGHRFYDHNFIVIRENKYQGSDYVGKLRNALKEALNRDIPEVVYMTDSIAGVRKYLSESRPNMLVIYAESEVLPVEILPLLYELNKELEIKILGLPEWDGFEQLEYKYLIDLKAYLFSGMFIDYNEPRVKEFIYRYRSAFQAEPSAYAYNGYDIAFYFLSLLMDYGKDFESCLPQVDYPLLQTRFRFKKINDGGYVNTHWNIYYFDDYSTVSLPGY